MTRWTRPILALLLPLVARAGVVETTGGKHIEGDVKLLSDAVTVAPAKPQLPPARVPIGEVKRVLIADEPKPVVESKWNDFDLGEGRVRGVSSMLDDDRLQMTFGGTGFSGRRRGRADQLHFRYQGVSGDFEIACRIATIDGLSTPGRVGLLVRENMDALAVCAAVGCSERVYRTTELYARDQPGDVVGLVAAADRAVLGSTWVKLTRTGELFRGYESIDGRQWRLVGEQKVVMGGGAGGEVLVGPFGFGGFGSAGGATAVFDHLELTQTGAGGKAVAATPPLGYVTPSGSIVALKSVTVTERGIRATRADGTDGTLPSNQVARIICGTRYALFADRVETGKTGVLLTGGDFVDGTVYRMGEGNLVGLTSVVFGPKNFDQKTQVAAAVFADVTPAGDWLVRTRDGSIYRGDSLLVGPDGVELHEGTLGSVKLRAADVTEFSRVK